MTAFRFGSLAATLAFSLVLLCSFALPAADGPTVRKAATPSGAGNHTGYPSRSGNDAGHGKKVQIGLSPVPYKPEPSEGQQEQPAPRAASLPDIRDLVKRVNRSVVSIRMLDAGSSFSLGSLGFSGDHASKAMGYGSGFIISSQGHIITNEHVLRNGTQTEVEIFGGKRFIAKTLFKDAKNDIALLKIDATNLQPIVFGDSDNVELGEWVVGIGNPYGIGQSIMFGIVSAQRRTVPGSGYPPLIQIDAAMNLGNSGGPLFNMDGQVIGINTILLWKSQGIGFATPINIAKDFLEKRSYPAVKAASAQPHGPMGPAADEPRTLPDQFNPLDPPWKLGR